MAGVRANMLYEAHPPRKHPAVRGRSAAAKNAQGACQDCQLSVLPISQVTVGPRAADKMSCGRARQWPESTRAGVRLPGGEVGKAEGKKLTPFQRDVLRVLTDAFYDYEPFRGLPSSRDPRVRKPGEAPLPYLSDRQIVASVGDPSDYKEQMLVLCDRGLDQLICREVTSTTMYSETADGPVIETPLHGAQVIHDSLIQSWGGKVRLFIPVPDMRCEIDAFTAGRPLQTAVQSCSSCSDIR